MRSGHTEAAVDLCKLANLPPVGVISELVNDDGSVMRGMQVAEFAKQNGLKIVSVADLISHRQRQESLIERVEEFGVGKRLLVEHRRSPSKHPGTPCSMWL